MRKAFTLIELAIVLVIVGLLLGGGMGIFSLLVKRSKIIETKDNLKANVEAVVSYATSYDRLPSNSEFKNVVKTIKDSWGKDFGYIADSNLLNNNSICERKTTNIILKRCKDNTCSTITQKVNDIAFIIFSGGANYNIQTSIDTSVNPNEIKIYEPSIKVDDNSTDINRVEEYDDIVEWVTLNDLRVKAGCKGSQINIVNNELPYGYVNNDYNATIYASGGIPFSSGGKYKWCYEGDLPLGLSSTPSYKSNDCLNDDESLWEQSDNFSIFGSPTSQGTYNIKIYVRDDNDQNGNNDNVTSKSFVITINPQTSSNNSSNGPNGAQISFAEDLSEFNEAEGDPNAIQTDTQDNTLLLGGGVYGSKGYGCFWYPENKILANKTMRAFFNFKFALIDTSRDSRRYADGFTFALMTGKNDTDVCGGAGSDMGYNRLPGDSIAVEFDNYPSIWGQNDPFPYNHTAILISEKQGNNYHGTKLNPPCSSGKGCYHTSNVTWLEDGVTHSVRVEIHTNYSDNNCEDQKKNGKFAKMEVWVDCENCDDLTKDYEEKESTISHCFELSKDLKEVKIGFTEGTWGSTQYVEISNFGIGFYD